MVNSGRRKEVDEENEEDQALEQISQAFLENLKHLPHENDEAFDKYSDIIRVHFYSRLPNFETRFVEGYHILVKQLSTENELLK